MDTPNVAKANLFEKILIKKNCWVVRFVAKHMRSMFLLLKFVFYIKLIDKLPLGYKTYKAKGIHLIHLLYSIK